jgi:excisionase family DNA binding protein
MQTEGSTQNPDYKRHLLRGSPKGKEKVPRKQRPHNPNRLTLTKAETAEELGVSIRTVDKFIKDGRLKARQLSTSHTIRILRTDLLAFLESRQLI